MSTPDYIPNEDIQAAEIGMIVADQLQHVYQSIIALSEECSITNKEKDEENK